jgi:hypothetical protein
VRHPNQPDTTNGVCFRLPTVMHSDLDVHGCIFAPHLGLGLGLCGLTSALRSTVFWEHCISNVADRQARDQRLLSGC